MYVVGYFLVFGTLGFTCCYIKGPPNNDPRISDVFRVVLQLIASICMYKCFNLHEMGLSVVIIIIVTKIFYKQIFESNLLFSSSNEKKVTNSTTARFDEMEYENVSMSFSPVKNEDVKITNSIFNTSPDATGFQDSEIDEDPLAPKYKEKSNAKNKHIRRKTVATSTYKITPTIFCTKTKKKIDIRKN